VAFHFFVVAVGRIERLLPFAAKAAGYKISKDDLELLRSYRPLRDYYEHSEDHFPGRRNSAKVVTKEERYGTWHIRSGLTLDLQGRLVFGSKAVDVTSRGLAAVEEVLGRNWEALKPSAIRMVREHYVADPSDIPGPEVIKNDLLARASWLDDGEAT
jgi:hypothetical protein